MWQDVPVEIALGSRWLGAELLLTLAKAMREGRASLWPLWGIATLPLQTLRKRARPEDHAV